MKAAIYCRTSSDDAKAEGIDTQLQKCRAWCQEYVWTVIDTFTDPDISGTTLMETRPGGRQLLDNLRQGKYQVVVTSDDQRLTRREDLEEIGRIINAFKAYGTKHYCKVSGLQNADEFMNRLMMVLKMMFSAKERQDIVERMAGGREKAMRNGQFAAGRIPYACRWINYRTDEKTGALIPVKKWVVDEREYKTLQVAFDLLLKGRSVTEVVNVLNGDLGQYRPRHAKKWDHAALWLRAMNDFYHNGIIHSKYGPIDTGLRLFPQQELQQIRTMIRHRRRIPAKIPQKQRYKYPFLLRRIARCADCGRRLGAVDVSDDRRQYVYYRCSQCNYQVKAKAVDQTAWQTFSSIVEQPDRLKEQLLAGQTGPQATDDRKNVERQLKAIDERLVEIQQQREDAMWFVLNKRAMTRQQYQEFDNQLTHEEQRLRFERQRLQNLLSQPEEIEKAVDMAVKRLSLEMTVFRLGDKLLGIMKDMAQLAKNEARRLIPQVKAVKEDLLGLIQSYRDDLPDLTTVEGLLDLMQDHRQWMVRKFAATGGSVTLHRQGTLTLVGRLALVDDDLLKFNQVEAL